MAKPDTDDGWFKMAHELDAALDVADFGKAERIVLNRVKAQIFGPAKSVSAKIVVRELVDAGGWLRQFIERGIRGLISARAITPVEGESDTYRFNKYYREWIKKGRSRFTDEELAFIASAPESATSYKQYLSNPRVAKAATRELQNATRELQPMQPESCRIATLELQDCNPGVADLASPLEPPIRKGELENRRIKKEGAPTVAFSHSESPHVERLARTLELTTLHYVSIEACEAYVRDWLSQGHSASDIAIAVGDAGSRPKVDPSAVPAWAAKVLKSRALDAAEKPPARASPVRRRGVDVEKARQALDEIDFK